MVPFSRSTATRPYRDDLLVRLGLVLVALLSGCSGDVSGTAIRHAPAASPSTVEVSADSRSVIALAVTELQPQPFLVSISAPGTVRSNQDTTALMGPVIEGQISQVLAGWGEQVTRGQVLAYLDSAVIGEAKAAHVRAQAALHVANTTVQRLQTLASSRIIAAKDLTAAEAQQAMAQAEADIAEKALQLMGFTADESARLTGAGELTSRMPLLAPISGTIVVRTAVVGAWVDPSDSLFTIIDLSSLWVDAEVFEKDLAAIHPGQGVTVSVVAFPQRTFAGQVSYIGDTVDENTRTTTVRTVVSNPDRLLKPGMFASVKIVTRDSPDTILLPEGALLQGAGSGQVVVEEHGHYGLRDVQVGMSSDGLVEIVAGLRFGEHVVTSGQNQIATELSTAAEGH